MRTGAGPPIRLRCAPLTRVGAEQDKAATLIAQLTAAAQAGLGYQEGQRILATCDHEPWYPALAAGGFSLDAAAWSQLGAGTLRSRS